jgi:small subunit ribosomal protein S8
MNVMDPIGDMLTRIRNAQQRGKTKVNSPSSRLRERVLEVLQTEGYIRGFSVTERASGQAELEVELKYFDGEPVIHEIKRVSKPGRRVYASVNELPTIYNGLGVAIMSTSKGVMSDAQARENNVGGEVICTVF